MLSWIQKTLTKAEANHTLTLKQEGAIRQVGEKITNLKNFIVCMVNTEILKY